MLIIYSLPLISSFNLFANNLANVQTNGYKKVTFEQILKETVSSQKVGKGTRESVQIILDNMQNSQEERE